MRHLLALACIALLLFAALTPLAAAMVLMPLIGIAIFIAGVVTFASVLQPVPALRAIRRSRHLARASLPRA